MNDVAVLLVEKFGAVAMALTVVLALTANGAEYFGEEVVGWLPSRVQKMLEPEVPSVIVTVCGEA
jgi:hypothetical protein